MGVIAVPVLFPVHRHNKSQRCPPFPAPCPAVLIGWGSCPSVCSWQGDGQPGVWVMVLAV